MRSERYVTLRYVTLPAGELKPPRHSTESKRLASLKSSVMS